MEHFVAVHQRGAWALEIAWQHEQLFNIHFVPFTVVFGDEDPGANCLFDRATQNQFSPPPGVSSQTNV